MNDIFISYASEDHERVKPLATALEKEGWSVFWDLKILAGESYSEIIENELKSARCVIVVWSRNSVSSKWVRAEAEKGLKKDILVPVKFEEVEIPLPFSPLQAANLVNWSGRRNNAKFKLLMKSITSILDEPGKQKRQKPAVKPKKRKTPKPKPDPAESGKKETFFSGRKLKLACGMGAMFIFLGIIALILYQAEEIHLKELDMKLVLVPAGTFERKNDVIEIPEPFYIQTTEVTQKQWDNLMISDADDADKPEDKLPAVKVSWDEAKDFIRRLNEKYDDKYAFRLPTELEWEYACCAGTDADFAFTEASDKITEYAWVKSNSKGVNQVGQKEPNQWGLYDICGNVMEWANPGPDKNYHVLRGGSFKSASSKANCRTRIKEGYLTTGKSKKDFGLRVAMTPK